VLKGKLVSLNLKRKYIKRLYVWDIKYNNKKEA
jgi:hypothetical protein